MNENGNNIRVATYARVSTQEQANEGTSLEVQESQFNIYCQLQGWTIINSYVDPGLSGKDDHRPGLQRMLSDAKIGLFQKIVVFKFDRLARNLRLLLDIEANLRDHNVSLISIKEAVDTSTATGKMIFQLFGMISEWERSAILERTQSGRLQRYKEGCWAGGQPPFGYAYNRETKKLVVSEVEATIVRRLYSEYNSGKSLSSIADGLNAEKVPARSEIGKGWRSTAIRQVMLNPAYKGTLIVNRNCHISDINKIDLSKTIMIPVPPLVSESLWQSAQDHLVNNKHIKPKLQGEFLLQGLITCGICGHAYQADRQRGYRYYACRGRLKSHHPDGSPRCNASGFNAKWLENEIWQRIVELLNDPNKLARVIEDSIKDLRIREDELSAKIRPIDERLIQIASQKGKLADDWVIRNMEKTKFQEIQQNLDKEETRLKAMRSNIDPDQIRELEQSREKLRFWESQLKSMAWNTENEDGSMFRLVDQPHEAVLKLLNLDDRGKSNDAGFPASKRELLDKLQLKLVVMADRIDVKSLFNIEPIANQLYTPMRG